MPDNNIRFYNLDFLKFIFTIAIVLLHISASNQQVDFYKNVYEHVDRSYLIVEFFFMVSGFFLYFEIQKENIQTFIKKRIIRLLPVIIFSLICGYIFISGKHKENILFSLLFLQGMGLQAPFYFHWFVSPLFWGSILYFFIFTNYKRTTATFFVAVLCYLSYCLLLNNNNGNIDIHVGMIKGFLSGSLLRALGGIGIGYFLGLSYDKFP